MKRDHDRLIRAAGAERFVLDRLYLDDNVLLSSEVERVRVALGRVSRPSGNTSHVASSPNSQAPFTVRKIHLSQAEAQAVADSTMSQLKCKEGKIVLAKGAPSIRGGQGFAIQRCRDGIDGSYVVRRAVHTLEKEGGITIVLDVYDEGNGVDFAEESTDRSVSFDGIPATTLPAGGIGHM